MIKDTNFLVSCSWDETLRIWDKKSGFCLNVISGDHDGWIWCCDSNQDYLISSGNSWKIIVYKISDFGSSEGNYK